MRTNVVWLAAEIPDGLLYGLAPVVAAAVFGLMAWMVRELGRVSSTNAATEARLEAGERRMDDHDSRLRELERGR